MPELPEVETIKKTLMQLVIDKEIKDVTVYWPNIVQHPDDVEQFKHLLLNQTIQDIKRRGKFLLFYLDTHVLISHLRMEGKYGVFPKDEPVTKHTHIIFHFTDETQLRYQDVRKFGTMHVFKKGEEYLRPPLYHLGPEPFEETFSKEYLVEKLSKTNRHIKTALLDQTILAGLGNIYVDEALFLASIHPMRRASDLSEAEISKLQKAIVEVLQEAVHQGGTTIRTYVNSQGQIGMFQMSLNVYGREDQDCKVCGESITKMRVGNRGTHVCLNCQK